MPDPLLSPEDRALLVDFSQIVEANCSIAALRQSITQTINESLAVIEESQQMIRGATALIAEIKRKSGLP